MTQQSSQAATLTVQSSANRHHKRSPRALLQALESRVLFDGVPVVSVAAPSIAESVGTNTVANIVVSLDQSSTADVTVSFTTASGTAQAGTDYVESTGTITIPAGQVVGTIPVSIFGDYTAEGDETFSVSLTGATVATLGTATATATITNAPFYSVPFSKGNKAEFLNASGKKVTYSMGGDGTGLLYIPGEAQPSFQSTASDSLVTATPAAVVITGSTKKTTVKISGTTTLSDFVADGELKSFSADHTTLTRRLNIGGDTKSVTLRDVIGQTAAPATPVTASIAGDLGKLSARDVSDLSVAVTGIFGTVSVSSWSDTDSAADLITATRIKTISAKNNFSADATAARIDSVKVGKILLNSILRADTHIGSVKAHTMDNSTIFAGVSNSVTALPSAFADFVNAAADIDKVTVTGGYPTIANSRIAAGVVKKVSLNRIKTENGGTVFGLASTARISSIRARTESFGKIKRDKVIDSFAVNDFSVRILAPVP